MTIAETSTSADSNVETHHTFCRFCHASCPIEVDVAGGQAVAIRGVPDDPLFAGYTCIKGRQIPEQMTHPSRLRTSLRRRSDGTFEEISSQDAMDAIGAELKRILAKGGAVGKRLDFMMQELNREANTLGSKSVDVEVTRVSLDLKLLIEQMREQIQNIE